MNDTSSGRVAEALELLERHHESFFSVVDIATRTKHPVPTDTRGWSQILVSVLTGVDGYERKKGPDLADGSDVKAANTWEAIDTPRFNGVIKAGTKAEYSGEMASLDRMPHLFFVLWDKAARGEKALTERCRIWCVRPNKDRRFRQMCEAWYNAVKEGKIISSNFQLHPPRGKDTDVIRNNAGNLSYPLLFCAEREGSAYVIKHYDPEVLISGECRGDPAGVIRAAAEESVL